jgi:hypothetical protein
VQVSDPIRDGWAVYKRFWRHLLPIAFVTYLIVSLIALALASLGNALSSLAAVVVAIAGVFLLQAALVEAVADVRDGRADLTLTETLGRVWRRIGSVAAASIGAAIAIVIGLILIVVPGLYLLTIWSVIVPVIVLEKVAAFDSFGRSRELVRGYGWTVLGVIAVTFAINVAASIVLEILFAGFSTAVGHYVGNVIANTLISPFVAAALTSMYFRLRELKESGAAATPTGRTAPGS